MYCWLVTLCVARLHLALNAYHELLQTLLAMEKTNDPQLRDSAKVMKSKRLTTWGARAFLPCSCTHTVKQNTCSYLPWCVDSCVQKTVKNNLKSTPKYNGIFMPRFVKNSKFICLKLLFYHNISAVPCYNEDFCLSPFTIMPINVVCCAFEFKFSRI